MKQVKAPNGEIVKFPDGTPDSVIIDTMAKTYGGSGTRQDFRAPGPVDLVAATRQTLGLPPKAPPPVPAGLLGDKRAPYGVGGMVARAVGAPSPKPPVLGDMARSVPTGLAEGTTGFLGIGGDLAPLVRGAQDALAHNIGKWTGLYTPEQYDAEMAKGRAKLPPELRFGYGFPSSAKLNDAVQKVTGPYYQPQTVPGQYARTVASFVPGAAAGGEGILGRLAPAVTAGLASESAGQLTKGTDAEPWARFGAGVAGGGLGALGTQPARAATEISNAIKNATPAELDRAALRLGQGQRQGIDLTWPEALDAVTGGRTNATRLLRTVESTKEGSAKLSPQLANRNAQVQTAIAKATDSIAPPVPDPFSLAARAKNAGQAVVGRMEDAVNDSASPIYARLPGNTIPGYMIDPATGNVLPGFNDIANNSAFKGALADFRGNPILNNAEVIRGQPTTYAQLPDNDLAVANRLSTYLGKRATLPDATEGAEFMGAKKDLDALASSVSPDYSLARLTYGSGRKAFVEPVEAGPIGGLARTTDNPTALNTQTAGLYPSASTILPGASNTVGVNLRMLNDVDPGIGSDLTAQYLRGAANETAGKLGPNNLPDPWGGAKFARAVDGSPEQSANLQAGIGAVSDEPTAQNWSDLLDVLHTTGMRVKPTLGAASFGEDMHDLERAANLAGTLQHAAVNPNPGDWLKRAGDTYERWRLGNVAGDIADTTVGSPEEQIDALRKIYAAPPAGLGTLGARAALPVVPAMPVAPTPQLYGPQP